MEVQSLADTRIKALTSVRAVYQAICYFDIFKHPLKAGEIKRFCPDAIGDEDLMLVLDELRKQNKISLVNGYYILSDSDKENINLRAENEIRLATELRTIKKYARLINAFPFVEATYISGSVSKGVFGENGDVDYFIISRPGRVWLCRTLLIAFKKMALFNSRKYFCVNYFIDTDHLKIPDENLFVATEIATMIPVALNDTVKKFEESNEWAGNLFPNHSEQKSPLLSKSTSKNWIVRLIEKSCSASLGEKLDNYFFRKTLERWQKKFPHFNRREFDLNMRSYKNVSKHHPQGNQMKVLSALAERMNKL